MTTVRRWGAPTVLVLAAALVVTRLLHDRPRVRDLKVGDTVSKVYAQLADADFSTVVRVPVAPQRPTQFEGRGEVKRPVAFAAAVEFDDGTREVVTTDTVYARRGATVDPKPFVARATGRTGGSKG